MYTTRSEMPNEWPLKRKGTKYIATASHSKRKSVPILFVLRDFLRIAKTKREACKILFSGEVIVNSRIIKDINFPIQIGDAVSIKKIEKHYLLSLENKKFKLVEISGKDSGKKIIKVIGKKILSGKKVQLNLRDGRNIISENNVNAGDSIVLNFENNKIEKILPLKDGAEIEIIGGKYAGEKGNLKEVQLRKRGKAYIIKTKDREIELSIELIKVSEGHHGK
jgi:small subunit ribosomal protein S4e